MRWNRACEQLLGYTARHLEAERGLLDLVPRGERPVVEAAFQALAAGESPVRTEFHWRTRDGELRLIAWSNTALTGPDGSVTHVVGTGIDRDRARGMGSRAPRWRRTAPHRRPRRPDRALQPPPLRAGSWTARA